MLNTGVQSDLLAQRYPNSKMGMAFEQ